MRVLFMSSMTLMWWRAMPPVPATIAEVFAIALLPGSRPPVCAWRGLSGDSLGKAESEEQARDGKAGAGR